MLQPPTPVCSIVTQYPISETTMNFSNLRVGPRLGLGFGVILLITAIIALGGMWRIGVLKDASERVATREIEQRTLVEDWASDIRLNWVRTEAFLKAIDTAYMEQLTNEMKATATATESGIVTYCAHGEPGTRCPECHPRTHRGVLPTPEQRAQMRAAVEDGKAAIKALETR